MDIKTEKFEIMEKFYNDLLNVVKEAYEELKQETLNNIIKFQHRTIDFFIENN